MADPACSAIGHTSAGPVAVKNSAAQTPTHATRSSSTTGRQARSPMSTTQSRRPSVPTEHSHITDAEERKRGTTEASRRIARAGRPTDDAGHLLGKLLGGHGGATSGNIITQNAGVNRGAFMQFERHVADALAQGKNVSVRVTPIHAGSAARPVRVVYQVRVDGRTTTRIFPTPDWMSAMTDLVTRNPIYLRPTGTAPTCADDESWIGSPTVLPDGLAPPVCKLCGAKLLQFFTLAFPEEHPYAGSRLTLYSCIACTTESGIPEMVPQLSGAHVSSEFLRNYQDNFSIVVAPLSIWRRADTGPGVRGSRLECARRKRRRAGDFGQLVGPPRWLLGDETPATVAEESPVFLAQVFMEHYYALEDGAPPQARLFLFALPPPTDYMLMNRNELYLFGPASARGPVYIFTQVD